MTHQAALEELVYDGWPRGFLEDHPVAVAAARAVGLDGPWISDPDHLALRLSQALGGPTDAAVVRPLLRGPDGLAGDLADAEGPYAALRTTYGDEGPGLGPGPALRFGRLARALFTEAAHLVRTPDHAAEVAALGPLYRAVFGPPPDAGPDGGPDGDGPPSRGPLGVAYALRDPASFAAFAREWPVDYLFHPTFHTVDRLVRQRKPTQALGPAARDVHAGGVRTVDDLVRWYRAAAEWTLRQEGVGFLDNDDHSVVVAPPGPAVPEPVVFRRCRTAAEYAGAVPPLQGSPYAIGDPFYEAAYAGLHDGETTSPHGPWYVYVAGGTTVVLDPYYRSARGAVPAALSPAVDVAFGPLQAERRPLLSLDD